MLTEISTASLEYVRARVAATTAGAAVNPTGDSVSMAFLTTNTAPVSGDWKTATWDTDATTTPATYRAQCLVGPAGTVTLTAGTYTVWVRITDSPEVVVKRSGQIRVV